jgi:putative hydrolase of the HAD superfamily
VEPALLRLKDKLTLGSVSNGFADLERIGLAGHRRLHRRPSLRSRQARSGHLPRRLRGTAGAPAATVYVGDDPLLDVGARSRPAAVWMNRFERAPARRHHPDAICRDLHELHDWLRRRA